MFNVMKRPFHNQSSSSRLFIIPTIFIAFNKLVIYYCQMMFMFDTLTVKTEKNHENDIASPFVAAEKKNQ